MRAPPTESTPALAAQVIEDARSRSLSAVWVASLMRSESAMERTVAAAAPASARIPIASTAIATTT
jgi:hypothetical protein